MVYVSKLTFPNEVGALDASPYLRLVAQACICHEGLVQAWSEVREAEGVVFPEVEEL